MGSLSDPNNFGARPVDEQPFYDSTARGQGRWATLDNLGVLWTDDRNALQLSGLAGPDAVEANALRIRLHTLAAERIPATKAFDTITTELGATPTAGDLADRP